MQVLMLAAVAAAAVFGWFLMKKLDLFLVNNNRNRMLADSHRSDILRIGFSDPLVAGSLSAMLEDYSKIQPDVSVCFFGGTETELIKKFSEHKLDMIFLPENALISDSKVNCMSEISLKTNAVSTNYGSLYIEPITEDYIVQKIFWPEGETSPAVNGFIGCLRRKALSADCMKQKLSI